MKQTERYIVYFGETSMVVPAQTTREAFDIVRNEYESEWGEGSFDQYEVRVETEDTDKHGY